MPPHRQSNPVKPTFFLHVKQRFLFLAFVSGLDSTGESSDEVEASHLDFSGLSLLLGTMVIFSAAAATEGINTVGKAVAVGGGTEAGCGIPEHVVAGVETGLMRPPGGEFFCFKWSL